MWIFGAGSVWGLDLGCWEVCIWNLSSRLRVFKLGSGYWCEGSKGLWEGHLGRYWGLHNLGYRVQAQP